MLEKILCLCIICCLGLFACCNPRGGSGKQAVPTPIADSQETRLRLAQTIIDAYPPEQFSRFLRAEVESVVGKDVLEDAAARLRKQASPQQLLEKRKELLVETFSAPELEKLAQLLSSAEGRTAFEKIRAHNEKWKNFISPFVLEALSKGD